MTETLRRYMISTPIVLVNLFFLSYTSKSLQCLNELYKCYQTDNWFFFIDLNNIFVKFEGRWLKFIIVQP